MKNTFPANQQNDNFIMALRDDGTLFVATQSTVYQVNPQTAAAQ